MRTKKPKYRKKQNRMIVWFLTAVWFFVFPIKPTCYNGQCTPKLVEYAIFLVQSILGLSPQAGVYAAQIISDSWITYWIQKLNQNAALFFFDAVVTFLTVFISVRIFSFFVRQKTSFKSFPSVGILFAVFSVVTLLGYVLYVIFDSTNLWEFLEPDFINLGYY